MRKLLILCVAFPIAFLSNPDGENFTDLKFNHAYFFPKPFSLENDTINYPEIFGSDYLKAIDIISKEPAILEFLEEKKEGNLMLSIVFPEMIRYSLFRDLLETTALEMGYAEYGPKLVDFSIGHFQMKPSFVEALEVQLWEMPELSDVYNDLLQYNTSDPVKIRRERIRRISNINWQLKYLKCFYDIVSARFNPNLWKTPEDKLRFMATAYNHGFMAETVEIKKWIHAETFPYGLTYEGKQHAYSTIAVYFYNHHFKNPSL